MKRTPKRNVERRHGIARDVLAMVLVRWIAVVAMLLGIAALASADETRAGDIGADASEVQRTARNACSAEERST